LPKGRDDLAGQQIHRFERGFHRDPAPVARLTLGTARRLFGVGAAEVKAVQDSWSGVGITVT
jgi:hypothetical protein